MRSICYVTRSLFPTDGIGEWALEVYARAVASAQAGNKVTIYWHREVSAAEMTAARAFYETWSVDLVILSQLEPFLAADEVFPADAALRLFPALRKLHGERRFDRIELPVADGLALRVVQAANAGGCFDGTRIVLVWGEFGEWTRHRARQLVTTRSQVKRDFWERESVELATEVECVSPALVTFAEEIGWQVAHVRVVSPTSFPVEEGPSAPEPKTPCWIGETADDFDRLCRWVGSRTPFRRWLAVLPGRRDERSRDQLQKAVRKGQNQLELLAARPGHRLPEALRAKGALVLHEAGQLDARLRWLAAGRVAFVFSNELVEELPALAEYSSLGFDPDDAASIVAALQAGQEFSDWDGLFAVVNAAGETPDRPPIPVPSRSPWVRPEELPRVLIAVSHYNLGELMRETLAALAAQDYPACDVLVVDDGSTDGEALESFRKMKNDFPSFEFVELPHEGYWSPRNFAIEQCQAPYIIIVDGDNLPVPQMASRYVEAMERNPDRDAFSAYITAFRETSEAARAGQFEGTHTPVGGDYVAGHFENVFGDTNSIFRIDAIRSVGGFRKNFRSSFGDWEIFHRLVGAGFRLGVVPEVLLHYRRRKGGMIRQSPLYPSYFEFFKTVTPGPRIRPADLRRLNHALHGLALLP